MNFKKYFQVMLIPIISIIFINEVKSQTNIGANIPINIPMSNMNNTATTGLLIGSLNFGYMFSPKHEGRIDLSYQKFGTKTYYNSKISGSFIPITLGYNYYFINNNFKLYGTINAGNYIGSGDFKKSHLGFAPGIGLAYAFPNSNIKLNFSPMYNIVSAKNKNIHYLSLNIGLAFKLSSGGSSESSTGKGSGTKELKFEKTNTSADGFLESSYNLGKRMKDLNTKLEDISLFVSVMLSNPADVIGKDVSNVVAATRQSGAIPADPNDLKNKLKDFKEIQDASINNSITLFIKDLGEAQVSLTQVPDDVTKLLGEATALPGKLQKELTGLGAMKIPKIIGAIGQSKTNLDVALSESQKLLKNIVITLEVLTELSKKVTP